MRACSIRLFGSAYQPGVLLGFGARLRFFLQKFSNFVWVLKKRIGKHVFPVWARVLLALFGCSTLCSAHLLGGLLGSAARKAVTSTGTVVSPMTFLL